MNTKIKAVADVECYRDFFLLKTRDLDTGHIADFAMWPGQPLDRDAMAIYLARRTIYTFNGNNYDLPIITYALWGADNQQLKDAGDRIIQQGLKPWQFYDAHRIQKLDWIDHVDVMEVAAGVRIGLKMYMGRMHSEKIQDLPIDPSASISPAERFQLSVYCGNDLQGTAEMVEGLRERLELREALSSQYGVDLRSKSDAQIAEAVIKAKLGFKPRQRYIPHGYTFRYEPPAYIRFATPELQALLEEIRAAEFVVSDKEEAFALGIEEVNRTGVQIPPQLADKEIRIGKATYRLGIGGLHSQESSVSYWTNETHRIVDVDVASYYPSLILNMGMYPEQLGESFLSIYSEVRDTRLLAKAEGRKTEADGLKIVLNGTFGKLFSKWSCLYAPEFGIRTTLSGQLSLLMLIELMESSGIQVISANTDGIVLLVPHERSWLAKANVEWWERATGLTMEESLYRSIHQRDVNNYVAITMSGKAKRKGVFAKAGLNENKHPDKTICAEAVVRYLLDGVRVEDTINQCRDIREFIVVRNVTGGGVTYPEGAYLGKAVRWYYGKGREGYIAYAKNGNKVAGSDGAIPLMQLQPEFPFDVDHQHYIEVCHDMLESLGVRYDA